MQQFRAFWEVTKRYAELTRSDPLIHRSVAGAVNGLLDFLEVERKRVPGDVLRDAERLECLLFSGYDPHFERMHHRDCKESRPCVYTFVSFRKSKNPLAENR